METRVYTRLYYFFKYATCVIPKDTGFIHTTPKPRPKKGANRVDRPTVPQLSQITLTQNHTYDYIKHVSITNHPTLQQTRKFKLHTSLHRVEKSAPSATRTQEKPQALAYPPLHSSGSCAKQVLMKMWLTESDVMWRCENPSARVCKSPIQVVPKAKELGPLPIRD